MERPVRIGLRRELCVDDHVIERISNLDLRLHAPQPAGTALLFDRPWEGSTSAYVTALEAEMGFRLYYRGSPGSAGSELACVAESCDGVRWERPTLNLFDVSGPASNNVVWVGEGAHNLAPFRDDNPAASAEQRYKALAGQPPRAFCSADGLRWRPMSDRPVLENGRFDSQNVAFWDGKRDCYAAYVRLWLDGRRWLGRSESSDFLTWTPPVPIELPEAGDLHLYTGCVQPYARAPHLLVAFPSRFVPDRQVLANNPVPGVSDSLLLVSRDGVRFSWPGREAFVRPGQDAENWGDRSNMVAWGLLPTGRYELSLYVSRGYRSERARLERYTVRPDGFASLHAADREGELLTRPLIFAGDCLRVNLSTAAAGWVRIELQDSAGAPWPGFELSQCDPLVGDELDMPVHWSTGASVAALAGQAVRLRMVLQEADLFAWRFAQG